MAALGINVNFSPVVDLKPGQISSTLDFHTRIAERAIASDPKTVAQVALAYSQQQQRLRCHHCDYHEPKPPRCPACGGTKLGGVGVGVERVQENVQAMFPKAKVERLDRDVTRRVGALMMH
jgi:hypothetical protein